MSIAKLDQQLCFALYSASNRLTSIYRPLLEAHDLTYTQFIVLMALWEKDGIYISQLAKKTGLSKATMTPLLKRLEKKGMIIRQQTIDNERNKHIVLTKSGYAMSEKSQEITEKAFCATNLSVQQAQDLIKTCHLIVNNS